VIWPRRRVSQEDIIAKAGSRGVGISGIARYYLQPPSQTGLMLGYCRMKEEEIREGIRRLGEVL
jgi:DNA-binding transcriptional MocR family regulator